MHCAMHVQCKAVQCSVRARERAWQGGDKIGSALFFFFAVPLSPHSVCHPENPGFFDVFSCWCYHHSRGLRRSARWAPPQIVISLTPNENNKQQNKSKQNDSYKSYHGATHGAITLTGDPRRWPNEPGTVRCAVLCCAVLCRALLCLAVLCRSLQKDIKWMGRENTRNACPRRVPLPASPRAARSGRAECMHVPCLRVFCFVSFYFFFFCDLFKEFPRKPLNSRLPTLSTLTINFI